MRLLIATLVLIAAVAAERVTYDGYKTYRVTPRNDVEVNTLRELAEDEANFDFWSNIRVPGRHVDVMVSPEGQPKFDSLVKTNNLDSTVLIQNVEEVFERERREMENKPKAVGKITWDQYYRYDDILAYLDQLAADYPNLVTVTTAGTTYEKREIKLVKISSGGNNQRPALFLEAGIHAREWIAPATALYLISQLVENNAENQALTDNTDWYIIPVTNPDGYEYTHTNERMWRKNRAPSSATCKGTDPNRNFGYHWGEEGASTRPCTDTYRGSKAFSENESAAVRDAATAVENPIVFYAAIHSFGPYFLYPWGYQWDLPDDWKDLDTLARDTVKAIEAASTEGSEYEIGSSTQLLYAASGGSDDWFKGVLGVKYAYTIELPGGGSGGFDPPPSLLFPFASETFEGFKVIGNFFANSKK